MTHQTTVDHDAARELELYAYNDYATYQRSNDYRANVAKRIKAGTYDAEKAPKLWSYWIERAARNYCKEFGGTYPGAFNKATRDHVAARVAVIEWTEIVEEVAAELAAELIAASDASKGIESNAARWRKAHDAVDKATLYPGCLSRHISRVLATANARKG